MLTELSIKNFAIIDQLSISFNEGLTVLTGETGAGKSIIIDAVQLLAGGRGSVEFVRYGEKKAEITGLFTLADHKNTVDQLALQYGIEIADRMLVLERTITNKGKSICRINGKLTTLTILREFGSSLIDIHTQHETQSLMDVANHIELLDLYYEEKLNGVKKVYRELYEELQLLEKKYQDLHENERQMSHRLDLLEFQSNEIKNAQLIIDEDEKLEAERNHLQNFEKVYTALQEAYYALNGEGKAIEWLNIAEKSLQENRSFNNFLAEKSDQLTSYFYIIEELSFELRDYKDQLQYDEARLNEIEARLNELSILKKKYGSTIEEILNYYTDITEEIKQIKNKDLHIQTLSEQIAEVKKQAYNYAKKLHRLRKKAAEKLKDEIHQELASLYLKNASFDISFKENNQLNHHGFDQIAFLLSTNLGEPLKELHKIASGGELSRIMLILKKIFAEHQNITTVIFDEIDTGVSGRVAQAIAEKMYQISHNAQVLCITHLPQVAAMSDSHMYIQKVEHKDRTTTVVNELSNKEKIAELSRMITGTELTETALEHADEMLQLTAKYKAKIEKAKA